MPSEKTLQTKQQIVAELTEKLKASAAGVVVDYKGIDVVNDTKLRAELREAGISYSVVKNTMLRFASKQVGLDGLDDILEGTTAIAISNSDPLSAARIIAKYADSLKDKFNIKGGYMDGKVIDAKTVDALSKIPAREVLIGKMLSSMNAPIANLAVVLDQIAKKTA